MKKSKPVLAWAVRYRNGEFMYRSTRDRIPALYATREKAGAATFTGTPVRVEIREVKK